MRRQVNDRAVGDFAPLANAAIPEIGPILSSGGGSVRSASPLPDSYWSL
jgi:hypothetical protein